MRALRCAAAGPPPRPLPRRVVQRAALCAVIAAAAAALSAERADAKPERRAAAAAAAAAIAAESDEEPASAQPPPAKRAKAAAKPAAAAAAVAAAPVVDEAARKKVLFKAQAAAEKAENDERLARQAARGITNCVWAAEPRVVRWELASLVRNSAHAAAQERRVGNLIYLSQPAVRPLSLPAQCATAAAADAPVCHLQPGAPAALRSALDGPVRFSSAYPCTAPLLTPSPPREQPPERPATVRAAAGEEARLQLLRSSFTCSRLPPADV